MPSIFISYRRTDAPGHAGRIYDRLVEQFGKRNVFMDLDSTAPGADFAEVIDATIASCDALVAVIGRDWLSASRPWRRARLLDDPHDWVRREIEAALERDIPVIPVLVEGARMPSEDELPEEIAGLARRHAVELSETAWNPQLRRLIDSLAATPPPIPPTHQTPPSGSAVKRRSRLRRSGARRFRAAAAATLILGAITAIALTVSDRGGGDDGGRPVAPTSLTAEEYRLGLTKICSEHLHEADRIREAEGNRPVLGPMDQLERRTTDRLKALKPPTALQQDHHSILVLWGRRLSLLDNFYERAVKEAADPDFQAEFKAGMERVDELSKEIGRRFAALDVMPECDLF